MFFYFTAGLVKGLFSTLIDFCQPLCSETGLLACVYSGRRQSRTGSGIPITSGRQDWIK
jgi:hypothetical protein